MRIAVVTSCGRRVGGIETYLATLLPELVGAGHEVLLWYEGDGRSDREPLAAPTEVPSCCAETLGRTRAVAELRAWRPDALYVHGLRDLDCEAEIQTVAPAVMYAHTYFGICISGLKTQQFPTIQPCRRRFGPACLFCYYPRRCGGWNPLTMWRLYRKQTKRLRLMRGYRRVLTASTHMRQEYIQHGFAPEAVYHLPLCLKPSARSSDSDGTPSATNGACSSSPWRLLYVGRLERLKGGAHLLRALDGLPQRLGRPIQLTVAGDGSERSRWQQLAEQIAQRTGDVTIRFPGWLESDDLADHFATTDLLVLPSLWPEPFGLVGPEAGLYGVPAAAYAVGGVPDWLRDGVNGHLAPADPPTRDGLADAIVNCLRTPAHHRQLRAGAKREAARFTDVAGHVQATTEVLERAAAQ